MCGDGLVNCLQWQEQSQTLFSAHSSGVVGVWQQQQQRRGSGGESGDGGMSVNIVR